MRTCITAVCCVCLASGFVRSDEGKAVPEQAQQVDEVKKDDTAAPKAKAKTKTTAKTKASSSKTTKPKAEKPKTPADAADVDVIAGPIFEALKEGLELKEPEPVVAAPAMRVGRVVVNNNAAMLQQWQNQFMQQYQSILTTELAVVRQFCDLPRDQRPKIKAAGEAALKEAALKAAQQQQQMQQPGLFAGVAKEQVNPRKIIRDGLAKALKPVLPEDVMKRYQEEVDSRVADRKQAAVLVIVARLDNMLFLSKEQRDQIAESLAQNWQDKWEQWLGLQGYPENYVPQMNDAAVSKYLTASQKSVWTTMPKVDFGFFEQGPMFFMANDGWWGDAPDGANNNGGILLDGIRINVDVEN